MNKSDDRTRGNEEAFVSGAGSSGSSLSAAASTADVGVRKGSQSEGFGSVDKLLITERIEMKRLVVGILSIVALGFLVGCAVDQYGRVVVSEPVVVAPAPEVELVPESYVWDGVEYVGVVNGGYVYLGPGNVWRIAEPDRLQRFHSWERSHPDWRRNAIRNEQHATANQQRNQQNAAVNQQRNQERATANQQRNQQKQQQEQQKKGEEQQKKEEQEK